SLATEPMRQSPALAAFLTLLGDAWPAALAFSTVLAIVSSSSLAVVVLILSLSAMGILSPALTVILVLGANLGGAVPPVIATMKAAASARRVTLGNLLVRGAGCLVVLPFAAQVADLLALLPIPAAKLPVDVHLAFNLVVALVLWPLSGPLSTLMEKLVPEEKQPETGPKYLDDSALSNPVVALSGATRESLRSEARR